MKFFVYTFLLMAALATFAFKVNDSTETIVPSKNIVTKSLTVNSFDELKVSNAIDVKFVPATGTPKVTVKAPDNLIDRVIVKTEGSKLVVRLKKNITITNKWGNSRGIQVTIIAPAPSEIDMSGATSFSADALNVKNLEVDLSGASTFSVGTITASKCEFDVSGASTVKVTNATVPQSDFDISGASNVKVQNLKGTSTSVDISGASNITLTGTTSMLDVEVSGASKASLANLVALKGKVEVSGTSSAKTHIKKVVSRSVTGMSTFDNIFK